MNTGNMKKTIRLTESDLHNMVRTAINEVLDNMDDTEKAYWLMRQRQQRPNTKAKKPVNYAQQFAQQFNSTMPYSNVQDANGNNVGYSGGYNAGGMSMHHGVDQRGNFSSETYLPDGTYASQYLNANGRDTYYSRNPGDKNATRGNVDMSRKNTHRSGNVQADRYRSIRDKYNQQRQSQQPQGN